jgi:hypothetical protein
LVAGVVVVAYTELFHAFLVDYQLINHLNLSGKGTMVQLGDLTGDQLLQVYQDPLFQYSHTHGIVLIVYVS